MHDHHNFKTGLLRVSLGFMALVLCSTASGVDRRITFERLSLGDGLSQSNIFAFTEDADGYLWMGTQSAADRFDGYQIQSFRHDPANPASLTSGAITGFYESEDGFLWISTEYGISRFELSTDQITRVLEVEPRPNQPLFSLVDGLQSFCGEELLAVFSNIAYLINPETLTHKLISFIGAESESIINSILRDRDGQIWLSDGEHLWVSDCDQNTFKHHSSRSTLDNIKSVGISLLALTPSGQIAWAGPEGLILIDAQSKAVINTIKPRAFGSYSDAVFAVQSDPLGGLWIVTEKALARLVLDEAAQSVPVFNEYWQHAPDWGSMEVRPRLTIVRGGDGLIWVSAISRVGAYDPLTREFYNFEHDPRNDATLPPSVSWAGYELFTDQFGVVWFGAKLGGVARYVPERHRFRHLRDPDRSVYVVRGVAETQFNNETQVWVGLDDAGFQMWSPDASNILRPREVKATFQGQIMDQRSIRVRGLATHPISGSVWFNSASWFGRIDNHTNSIVLLSRNPSRSLRHRSIAFSPDGQFLYHSDGETLVQHEFNTSGERIGARAFDWLPEKISSLRVGAIHVLQDGIILLVAEDRLYAVNPWTQQVTLMQLDDPVLQESRVVSMLSEGATLWLGTRDFGILETKIVSESGRLALNVQRQWSLDQGLPDVTIYAMAKDLNGRLWASTNRGITRIDLAQSSVLNFTTSDGLQADEFNTEVVHRTATGRLYFGGINGVNYFDPAIIEQHPTPPMVHLKSFEVNQQPTDSSGLLAFDHDQNNWVFEYVGIHSVFPERNRFAYRLEGLNSDWVEVGPERIARYTGLNPGQYRFLVKSANGDGIWSEPKVILEATIRPPPWLSPVAYTLYILLAIVLTMTLIWRARAREIELQRLIDLRTEELRNKNDLVVQQSEALQEALNARTLFFANVSHELRTPLTLIDANLSRLDKQLPNDDSIVIAKRYLKRLDRLVDQLLDLSRIRLHGVQTEATPWSVDELIRSTIQAYSSVAQSKGIELRYSDLGHWYTRADQSSIEKILLNLMTNAIKFTPEHGQVEVRLERGEKSGLWIRIQDTGIGIPEEDQKVIFERFYRVPIQESTRTTGAGIGLSLVAEAVAAIGGTIQLNSTPGVGSTFSFWIPATQSPDELGLSDITRESPRLTPTDADTEWMVVTQSQEDEKSTITKASNTIGTLLVIEDNEDLRFYLTDLLSPQWQVISAEDGLEALECLEKYEIDVILSDIMMPRMDGLSLLAQVRDNLKTSHIPFLFLTARGDDETELKSLMLSADDFVRKPFEAEMLTLKLKNIWTNRQRLRAYLGQSAVQSATSRTEAFEPKALSPRDHRFLNRLSDFMTGHFQDPDLSVGTLAQALAVDERTLQRKIRALYDQTPAFFINEYRINHACQVLLDPTQEIQEVAYQCGYNSARYFSRVFKEHRGQTPSQWRQTAHR